MTFFYTITGQYEINEYFTDLLKQEQELVLINEEIKILEAQMDEELPKLFTESRKFQTIIYDLELSRDQINSDIKKKKNVESNKLKLESILRDIKINSTKIKEMNNIHDELYKKKSVLDKKKFNLNFIINMSKNKKK